MHLTSTRYWLQCTAENDFSSFNYYLVQYSSYHEPGDAFLYFLFQFTLSYNYQTALCIHMHIEYIIESNQLLDLQKKMSIFIQDSYSQPDTHLINIQSTAPYLHSCKMDILLNIFIQRKYKSNVFRFTSGFIFQVEKDVPV